MPYIDAARREVLEHTGELPVTPGELNFCITSLAHRYLKAKGLTYANGNEVVGALESAKLEFYRTVLSPYEDKKRTENGSISEFDTPEVQSPAATTPTTAVALDVNMIAEAMALALKSHALTELRQSTTPARTRVAKRKLTPPTPPASEAPPAAPSTSRVRRQPQVIGKQPGADTPAPPASVQVAPAERPKSSLRREAERQPEQPAKGVDRHLQSVFDDVLKGNGEDDF